MITIPMQLNRPEYDLFIILEDDNIARIKDYDPAEIAIRNLGSFANLKLRNIVITYAGAEEIRQLTACKNRGDVAKCLQRLSRGWKFQPELGDSDAAYQAPAKN